MTHDVLQAATDALATARGLDDIAPTVLRIAAQDFGAETAAFFDVSEADWVRLRYWLHRGRVLRPHELVAEQTPERRAIAQRLADGFTVPPDYLGGAHPSRRVRGVVVDHLAGTPEPTFDAWAAALDCEMELNVPCVVGGLARGTLVIYRRAGETFTPSEIARAEALAKLLALAVQLDRLGEEARAAAIAREREAAAEERAAELARANQALQAVTDALARAQGLHEIVPSVLRIAAETFGVATTAYFDVSEREVVQLRYWLRDGRVATGEEMRGRADDGLPAMPSRVIDGFTVPAPYLDGASPSSRTRALVIDHARGTVEPDFDAHAMQIGCELELNVPCVVGGVARGALVVYRRAGERFSDAEIALAEGLAKQLALAVQADRLASEARATAVAREREAAAERRAAALAEEVRRRTHAERVAAGQAAVVSAAVERLANATDDPAAVPDAVVKIRDALLAALVEQLDGEFVDLWQVDHARGVSVLAVTCYPDGRLVPGTEQPDHPGHTPIPLEMMSLSPAMAVLDEGQCFRVGPEYEHPTHTPFKIWMRSRGVDSALLAPIRLRGRYGGALGVCCRGDREFPAAERELAITAGRLLALALEAERLSEQARQAAAACERERAARERAGELARANDALQSATDALATARGLDEIVPTVLRIAAHTFGVVTAGYFEHAEDEVVRLRYWYRDGAVLRPAELRAAAAEGSSAFPDWLIDGFGVPTEYLAGATPTKRSRAVVLDHVAGTGNPRFDEVARSLGVDLELNVPCVVGGVARGALVISRPATEAFGEAEIALAEALAKQLALAVEADRLTAEASRLAVLGERTRLAREIHDTIAQGLIAILMHARAAASDATAAVHRMELIERLAVNNLVEARRAVQALRAPSVERDGLGERLRRAVERLSDVSGATATVTIAGRVPDVDASVEDELLRIAQEAVTNALKHAAASAVEVELAFTQAGLRLCVSDDGRGFDPSEAFVGRFGLLGMQERADRVGAAFTLVSEPGRGTRVIVLWRPAEPPGNDGS